MMRGLSVTRRGYRMPLVAPVQGLPLLIGVLFKDGAPPALNWVLILWANNLVPDADTELLDLVPASFSGYSDVELSRGGWTPPALVGDKSVVTYGTEPTIWYVTGSYQTIYGYAIYDPAAEVLLIVERFPSPVILTALTTRIGVLPRVTLATEE